VVHVVQDGLSSASACDITTGINLFRFAAICFLQYARGEISRYDIQAWRTPQISCLFLHESIRIFLGGCQWSLLSNRHRVVLLGRSSDETSNCRVHDFIVLKSQSIFDRRFVTLTIQRLKKLWQFKCRARQEHPLCKGLNHRRLGAHILL
jgi:hypothetical protein